MNFLSHFYFDRYSEDPHLVLGTVLPDLVKNARKDWNIHPEKNEHLFASPSEKAILDGWKRHLKVDRHFHNSGFFIEHTGQIRKAITPALSNSIVRPSFLAHIALELLLDSNLLIMEHVRTNDFYSHLRESDREAVKSFLRLNKLDDTDHFFIFYDKFINSGYLENYREHHNLVYALKRVCMRIWDNPLTDKEVLELNKILNDYNQNLLGNYMDIYEEIHLKLQKEG